MRITCKLLTTAFSFFLMNISAATPPTDLTTKEAVKAADATAQTMQLAKQSTETKAKPKEVSIDEVKNLKGKVLVDALKEGDMIEGAIRIPADADDKTISEKLKDKNAEIIVYCGSIKCPASTTLAERLIGLGYTNVSHYPGGLAEWKDKGLPVTTTQK